MNLTKFYFIYSFLTFIAGCIIYLSDISHLIFIIVPFIGLLFSLYYGCYYFRKCHKPATVNPPPKNTTIIPGNHQPLEKAYPATPKSRTPPTIPQAASLSTWLIPDWPIYLISKPNYKILTLSATIKDLPKRSNPAPMLNARLPQKTPSASPGQARCLSNTAITQGEPSPKARRGEPSPSPRSSL